jgi:hypothetical protein
VSLGEGTTRDEILFAADAFDRVLARA